MSRHHHFKSLWLTAGFGQQSKRNAAFSTHNFWSQSDRIQLSASNSNCIRLQCATNHRCSALIRLWKAHLLADKNEWLSYTPSVLFFFLKYYCCIHFRALHQRCVFNSPLELCDYSQQLLLTRVSGFDSVRKGLIGYQEVLGKSNKRIDESHSQCMGKYTVVQIGTILLNDYLLSMLRTHGSFRIVEFFPSD